MTDRPEPTRAELHALLDELLDENLPTGRDGSFEARRRRDVARFDAHRFVASARGLLVLGDGPEVSAARGITVGRR